MKSDAELARIYRTRAESLRACKTGTDAEAQTRLEELAGDCDMLAARYEHQPEAERSERVPPFVRSEHPPDSSIRR